MAETTVGSGQCQVMVLSPERKWDILARRGRLELLRNTATNQYRMVARDMEGAAVLINSNVVLSRNYRKMSDKFFSWNDGSKAYGFQFFTSEEMEGFLLGFDSAVNSEGARPEPPPIPRRTESGNIEAHATPNPSNPFASASSRTSLGTAPVLPTPPVQPATTNPLPAAAAAPAPVRSSVPEPAPAAAPTQPAVTRVQSKPTVFTPPTSMTSPPRAPVPPSAPAPPPAPSAPRPPAPPPAPAPPATPAAPRPPAPPGAGGPPPPPPPPPPMGMGAGGEAKKLTMAEEIAMKKLKKSAGPPPESAPSAASAGAGAGAAPAGGSAPLPKGPMGGLDLMGDMAKKLAERRAKAGDGGGDVLSKFEPKKEEEKKEEPTFRRPSASGTLNPPSPGSTPKGGDVSPKPWRARSTSNSARDEQVVTRAEFEDFKREVLGEIKKMKEEILAALQQR